METPTPLCGLITLREGRVIERYFPGILALYQRLEPRPKTFLELVWLYCEKQGAGNGE
jgi:hypothetical protein